MVEWVVDRGPEEGLLVGLVSVMACRFLIFF